ncbi:MAG: hypothetical protein IJ855_04820 [Bacteroidales bacterium]|nr:hypothetical protein [Bacteroidales bacterium]
MDFSDACKVTLLTATVAFLSFICFSSCKSEAQRQQEALNLDSLKTLTVMGRPDLAYLVDSLGKAYNTEDKHLVDSAKAEVAALDVMVKADSTKDAIIWALNKRDLLYYIPEMNYEGLAAYHNYFRNLYFKYLSPQEAYEEVILDNEADFLFFTAKPVSMEDQGARKAYENIVYNLFYSHASLGQIDQAIGYNAQMTYLISQRYGNQSYQYARCLADGVMALAYRGDFALAEERLKTAEKVLDDLHEATLKNPDASSVTADSILARKAEIRNWFEDYKRNPDK